MKKHRCEIKSNRSYCMNTREIAAEYRLSHWSGIIRERQESGLSIKAYCRTSGIHPNVYFYWQRKLREAACENFGSASGKARAITEKASIPTGWAICESAEPIDEKKELSIEIGRCRIVVQEDISPELLAKVCRVLTSLC